MTEIEIRRDATAATAGHTPQPIANEPAGAMRLVEWAREAEAAHHLASALVRTPFAGSWKGDIDGATAAILKGSEVGLTPVTALGAFDNIQGTPAPKAITLRALVQSHGHDLEIIEETDQRATARYRRNGKGDWLETSFTMDNARSMKLDKKDNWVKQPAAMLVARVTSKAARLVASDVILGIGYSAEEVRDDAPWDGTTRPPVASAGTASDRMAAALGTTTVEQVADDPETGEAMTDKSRREMFALFTQKGVEEGDQLPGINHLCGTAYESRGDLTEADCRRVIEMLRSRPDAEDPS